ncbi:hypothetical protein [Streptomyces sp. DSM 40750]|uniref:hypothetical protein n=1 Tax=Streptomyces sp. DSM 40750 TaxID=2801030 RepID=UPI00214B6112|nr:hypothetical protein [Streptomyces sp. DSM 40750]UUU19140.1 hypothetical protein JIX55_01660 [Streptomyces sp. DSM 40750]UUU27516.1 hypothetical protein JIX55_49085 [Streptomyces sp. DSM 40750]
MLDPELLERITARRAELDELEEKPAKHLAEVRAELDELTVAERVLERMSEQLADERASVAPAPGQVGGRAAMLIPHRTSGVEETTLPPDYQRILAAVRQTAGPVKARQVGDALGIDVSVRAKQDPIAVETRFLAQLFVQDAVEVSPHRGVPRGSRADSCSRPTVGGRSLQQWLSDCPGLCTLQSGRLGQ